MCFLFSRYGRILAEMRLIEKLKPSKKGQGSRANQAAQVANHQRALEEHGGAGDNHINQEQNYNWQISKRNLRERFEFLFNNEALADVHFIVGTESTRIPAHKLVLSGFIGSKTLNVSFN